MSRGLESLCIITPSFLEAASSSSSGGTLGKATDMQVGDHEIESHVEHAKLAKGVSYAIKFKWSYWYAVCLAFHPASLVGGL